MANIRKERLFFTKIFPVGNQCCIFYNRYCISMVGKQLLLIIQLENYHEYILVQAQNMLALTMKGKRIKYLTSYANCLSLKSGKGEEAWTLNQLFNSMSGNFRISCSNCHFNLEAEHLFFPPVSDRFLPDSDVLLENLIKDTAIITAINRKE